MPRATTRTTGRVNQLTTSISEFMAKHEDEFAESDEVRRAKLLYDLFPGGSIPIGWVMKPSPERDAWMHARATSPDYLLINRLKRWWLVRLLGAAKRENSPEAYNGSAAPPDPSARMHQAQWRGIAQDRLTRFHFSSSGSGVAVYFRDWHEPRQ
jgi:hypothetical protein